MSSRKTISGAPGDVPTAIVVGVVTYLAAVFVPIVTPAPDLPTALPPLTFDARAISFYHGRLPDGPVPGFVDEAFQQLSHAAALRDPIAVDSARRDFAAMIIDGGLDAPSARLRVREHHLRRFLAAIARGSNEDLAGIAARHGLTGAHMDPPATGELLAAWFDFRWETYAAREGFHNDAVPIERSLAPLPPDEQRAFVGWMLEASCAGLLGAENAEAVSAAQLAHCAALRHQAVDIAHSLAADYPSDEAHAAVEVALGRALEHAAAAERDGAARGALEASAREAFTRARGIYQTAAQRDPSRRLRRYLAAADREAGLE